MRDCTQATSASSSVPGAATGWYRRSATSSAGMPAGPISSRRISQSSTTACPLERTVPAPYETAMAGRVVGGSPSPPSVTHTRASIRRTPSTNRTSVAGETSGAGRRGAQSAAATSRPTSTGPPVSCSSALPGVAGANPGAQASTASLTCRPA